MDSDSNMMGMTVTRNYYDPKDSARWFTVIARLGEKSDEFEFAIPLFEAMKYPYNDFNWYIGLAVENVNNYRRRFGIKGNQTHIFDFIDSDFLPRENIDWP